MKRAWLWLMVALLFVALAPAVAAETYDVVYPSEAQRTIAPGRDFYVFATVPADAETAIVRLKDGAGEMVREIAGGLSPTFYLEYEGLNAFNTDQAEYFMPDLIYEPDRPGSLYDGSIKCYMQDGLLMAVIPGGVYRMDDQPIVDGEGVPYAELLEGTYTLEVEAGEARMSVSITMGPTDRKVMSRFTPDGHMTHVTDTAGEGDIQVFLDPFPGYWSPPLIIPGQEGNPYFAEIKDRWQLADAMEYYSGAIHFFIYNVSPGCTTHAVEVAALQLDGAIDTRVISYHYDIGEPLLGYAEIETDAYLMGTLIPFGKGDRLALTRAEVTDAAQDNYHIVYEGEARPIDVDVYDGVSVPAGKALTLFGVVCPIQNDVSDLTPITLNAWEVGNLLDRVEYAFTCGEQQWAESRAVGLTRVLDVGWEAYSLYEFSHSFIFPEDLAGQTVSVAVQGFDTHGNAVEGAAEMLEIFVTE